MLVEKYPKLLEICQSVSKFVSIIFTEVLTSSEIVPFTQFPVNGQSAYVCTHTHIRGALRFESRQVRGDVSVGVYSRTVDPLLPPPLYISLCIIYYRIEKTMHACICMAVYVLNCNWWQMELVSR